MRDESSVSRLIHRHAVVSIIAITGLALLLWFLAPTGSWAFPPPFDCSHDQLVDEQTCRQPSDCSGCWPTGDPGGPPTIGQCLAQGNHYTYLYLRECVDDPPNNVGYCRARQIICWDEFTECVLYVDLIYYSCMDGGVPPGDRPGIGECRPDPQGASCNLGLSHLRDDEFCDDT
jgi:hypothetical protein